MEVSEDHKAIVIEPVSTSRTCPTCWEGTIRRIGREAVGGCVAVFALFGPYLSQFLRGGASLNSVSEGRNAFWFLWEPRDILGLFLAILAVVAMAVLVREILRAWQLRPLLRVFDHAFVLALAAGVLANLWFHTKRPVGYHIAQFGVEVQASWALVIALLGYSLATPHSRLVHWASRLCQVISPAILIVAYQLFSLPTVARPKDTLTSNNAARPCSLAATMPCTLADKPVYLFIFDEWSYRRTYQDGRCRSSFPNLTKLFGQATTFHDAHSPGTMTTRSVPAILRGTPDAPELAQFRPGFVRSGSFAPATDYPSIFTRAGCADYRKVMIHWGFATSLWVADELDLCRGYSFYPRGDTLLGDAILHWYNAAYFWADPWSALNYKDLKLQVEDAHSLDLYRRVDEDIRNTIRYQPARTFAIIHYPFPHYPFLLNADGSYHGRDWGIRGYERNLAYLDRAIGRIVDELKSAGHYDEAMLILTSDHSYRWDSELPKATDEELTHVPLIIKLPGQTQPRQITEDFRTCHLGEFIAHALGKQPRSDSIAMRVP